MSSSSADDEKPQKCLRRIQASTKAKNKIKKQLKHSKSEVSELSFQIAALKSRADKLIQESSTRFDALKKLSTEKEQSVKQLSEKLAASSGELTFTKSLIEKRSADLSSINSEITRVETELAKTLVELKKAKQEEHNVEEHEKQLEALAAREQQQIAELQAAQAKEAEEIGILTKKVDEEKAKFTAVQEELRKLDIELETINRNIKSKEIEIEHLGGIVEEIKRKIPPLHEEHTTTSNLSNQKKDLLTKVTTDLGLVLERYPIELGEKKDLLQIYDVNTLSLEQLKAKSADLEHDIHDVNAAKQSLQATYLQAIEAHKAEVEHVEKVNAELNDITGKLKIIRRENDEVFALLNDLKTKVKALATEEASLESAEAALREREEKERVELEEIKKKEREEREISASIKKSLVQARHSVQDNEVYIVRHKQTLEKANADLAQINEVIAIRDKEILAVVEESNSFFTKIAETNKSIDAAVKTIQQLELRAASLVHLETDLDEKIKELAHKEAVEHIEFENSEAKIASLQAQLAYVQADIAKANLALGSHTKVHENLIVSAQADIKTLESQHAHHLEVHVHREKQFAEVQAKSVKYSAPKVAERKAKKRQYQKEGKRVPKFHKRNQLSSSSSSD